MAGKNTSVFGIYKNRTDLEHAVDTLRAEGFRSADISVLFPDNEGTKDFAHEKHTKAPEGTTTGATAGAIVGGVLGWLTGIGALAIPGIGPFIAAGPIMAALAGAGAVGTVGGLAGALIGSGIPEYEAKRYEGRVREGGILLSVHCDESDWVDKAKDILERTGATDISSASEEGTKDKDVRTTDTSRDLPPREESMNRPVKTTKVEPVEPRDIEIDRPSSMDRPEPPKDITTEGDVTIRIHRNSSDKTPGKRPSRDIPYDPDRPIDPDLPPDSDTDLP